jgi:diguanylate cyclase (GGDEF)-like protein
MKAFNPKDFHILVVSNVGDNGESAIAILKEAGYAIATSVNELQTLEIVKIIQPDLIVLNTINQKVHSLKIGLSLHEHPEYTHIPLICLTTAQGQEELLATFDDGIVDYINEPINSIELLTCIKTHLKLKQNREEMQKAYLELEKLVNTDPLTEIANRRALLVVGEKEFSRAKRYERPFSVLTIDIDRFKQINDTYGHDVGDRVLVRLAQTVTQYLRKVDCFGRFGGEEFLIFLPETSEPQGIKVAERIRYKIAKTPIDLQGQTIKITVSIGVATYRPHDENLDTMLKRADRALYEAKNCGRNKVVFSVNVEQSHLKLTS